MLKFNDSKRVWIFCIFVLLPGFILGLICPALFDRTSFYGNFVIWVYSFWPASCMFLTRCLTREGIKDLWFESRINKGFQYTVVGWYGTLLVMIAGQLLFFAFNPYLLDLSGNISEKLNAYKVGIVGFPLYVLSAMFLLGEEWGWRGYLLPKLTTLYGIVPSTMFVAVIWTMWHFPLIIAETNGLGTELPYTVIKDAGLLERMILLYFPLCLSMSMICSFLTLKSRSVIPSVTAHACYNSYVVETLTLVKKDVFDSSLVHFNVPHYYSIMLFFLIGVVCMIHLRKQERTGKLLMLLKTE